MNKGKTKEARLRRVVEDFCGTRVIVVGDVMVDQYFWGTVKRISPEAPVPVVDVTGETRRLGGAANVAHNIRALGGEPFLCGVAGVDAGGEWLLEELQRLGIDKSGIVVSEKTPTTVKSRVVAHSQQIVRFDRERRQEPPPESLQALQQALDDAQLIVRINNLEILWHARFNPMTSQQAVRQAVKSADPQVPGGHLQQGLDTAAHLAGGNLYQ